MTSVTVMAAGGKANELVEKSNNLCCFMKLILTWKQFRAYSTFSLNVRLSTVTYGIPIFESRSSAARTLELLLFCASVISTTTSESDTRFVVLGSLRSDDPS